MSKGGWDRFPRTQTTRVRVTGARRLHSRSALAPREGPGEPQRPPGAQVMLPPTQVGTRLWAPGGSQTRIEAAGGGDSPPIPATLVQPSRSRPTQSVKGLLATHTHMCTCAQNEHMWNRCVLRASGVQRATHPLRGQKPRHVPRPPAGGSRPRGQAPREPRVPTVRASGRTLPPEALPGLLVGGHGRELDGGAVGTGSRVVIPGTCSRGWGGGGGRRLRREGPRPLVHALLHAWAPPEGQVCWPHLGLQRSASQTQAPGAGGHTLPGPGGTDGQRPPAARPGVKRGSEGGSLPLE